MRRGDRCMLIRAPQNAILRAVKQMKYSIAWYFIRREDGFMPRVHYYDDGRWRVDEESGEEYLFPFERVEIIDFFDGAL